MSFFYTACALLIGSLGTLTPKFLLSSSCNSCGDSFPHAPLAAASCVFIGQMFCLIVPFSQKKRFLGVTRFSFLLLPSILALLGTGAQIASLLFLPASVLSGFRGLLILWTAQLSSYFGFSDSPASPLEWRYIYTCVFGTLLIGLSAFLEAHFYGELGGEGGSGVGAAISSVSVLFGITFAVVGYGLASAQVALEQMMLSSFTRWEILGVEGAIGTFLFFILMVPLQLSFNYSGGSSGAGVWGVLDVPSHTICCLEHSNFAVPGWAIMYGLVAVAFNSLLLLLSQTIGPNYRVFIFTSRGAITLLLEYALWYSGGFGGVKGSPLTPYSSLELFGFGLLIYGGVKRAELIAPPAIQKDAAAQLLLHSESDEY